MGDLALKVSNICRAACAASSTKEKWRSPQTYPLGAGSFRFYSGWLLFAFLAFAGNDPLQAAPVTQPPLKWRPAGASPFVIEVRRHYYRRRRQLPAEPVQQATRAASGKQGYLPAPSTVPLSGKNVAKGNGDASGKSAAPIQPAETQGPPPPPETWTEAEIKAGRTDCERRLSGLHALFDTITPIREGACGLPAPLRLRGFESADLPELEFSPPPTISCRLTEALHRWLQNVVQIKAKAHLNAAIVRIVNLQAYNCRSRHNDGRLSQHAYANAIDISEFVTARGERITVLDHWDTGDERSAFLRAIHRGACEIFGTTLGPEANDAHKNHFHLDMTERRHPLCDFTPAQLREREEAKKHPVVPLSVQAQVPTSHGEALGDRKR